jgi:hypothetical protein
MSKIKQISKHCQHERIQQRGVPMKLIELVSIYGECHRRIGRGRHPSSLYFSKKSFEKMRRDGVDKQLMIEAESRPNLRFLFDEVSGSLITVVHVDKNKQRVH